jgi:hypothetical protein
MLNYSYSITRFHLQFPGKVEKTQKNEKMREDLKRQQNYTEKEGRESVT